LKSSAKTETLRKCDLVKPTTKVAEICNLGKGTASVNDDVWLSSRDA